MIEFLPPVSIPPQDLALRQEIRAFLDDALAGFAPDLRARSWMGYDADFSRALARRGWLGLTLPRAYGGAERGHFARFVLSEELLAAGAPVSAHWIADRQSAPLILKYGTEAQRRFYLPRICRAEAFFCIGMSEPDAGSDLASIRTRARPDGAGWILDGAKIWTTNAQHAHYMIALARTSGTPEDRHAGLSQVIIDLKAPGVTVRPIVDVAGDAHFCEVFFDQVRLGPDALIGTEGDGWAQVNAELAFERSGPERLYSSMALVQCWLERCRAVRDPAYHALTGRILAQLATLRSMSLSIAGRLARGESPAVEAALVKDLGTELEQRIPALIGDALGASSGPPIDDALWRTLAYLDRMSPTFSLRGGTREILRGIIARGLDMR
ncbi:acyl-CoA dehydrogenase family protein [Achromobacter aloeverae]